MLAIITKSVIFLTYNIDIRPLNSTFSTKRMCATKTQKAPVHSGQGLKYYLYNIFPAMQLSVSTAAMYTRAIKFTQVLALIFSFLRKTRDKIVATKATAK